MAKARTQSPAQQKLRDQIEEVERQLADVESPRSSIANCDLNIQLWTLIGALAGLDERQAKTVADTNRAFSHRIRASEEQRAWEQRKTATSKVMSLEKLAELEDLIAQKQTAKAALAKIRTR